MSLFLDRRSVVYLVGSSCLDVITDESIITYFVPDHNQHIFVKKGTVKRKAADGDCKIQGWMIDAHHCVISGKSEDNHKYTPKSLQKCLAGR